MSAEEQALKLCFIILLTATEGPQKSVWDQATADGGEASRLPVPARYVWNNLQRVCIYSHNIAFFFILKKKIAQIYSEF